MRLKSDETSENVEETAPAVDAAPSDVEPTPAPEPGTGANLFRIRRTIGGPRIVTVVVLERGHSEPRSFDERLGVFDVDRETAIAAVESGGFEIAPDSRARLKE